MNENAIDIRPAGSAIDEEIVAMVDHIRNRYGARGLRQLIDLANEEMRDTESALAALSE
jgi:hypothetical protein